MNPTAPATYRILLTVLARKETSQRELVRNLKVSLGQVNKVFQWLEENHFVERSRAANRAPRGRAQETYTLTNPTGLLRAISLFRPMSRLRRFTVAVDVRKEELLSDLRKRPVVFCLGTALERFSRFYRSDEISFYALDGKGPQSVGAIRNDLAARKEGITRATCYLLPAKVHGRRASEPIETKVVLDRLIAHGFADRASSGYFTTKVQTVVDLFCDGKAFAARDLLKELWGVEL